MNIKGGYDKPGGEQHEQVCEPAVPQGAAD
jgi:hypothetical protein